MFSWLRYWSLKITTRVVKNKILLGTRCVNNTGVQQPQQQNSYNKLPTTNTY